MNITFLYLFSQSLEPPEPRSADSRTLSQLEQENETLKERLLPYVTIVSHLFEQRCKLCVFFFLFLRLNKKEAVYLLLQEELRREKELRKKLEAEVIIKLS